jgi:transcription elongation factor Elf1
MAVTQKALRSLLSDAIVELCRREAFYVEELRIEGTICVVSDRTAALIVQITEQVGDKPCVDERKLINDVQLPVVVTTDKIDVAVETQLNTDTDQNGPSMSQTMQRISRRRRLRVCRLCGARFVRRGSLQSHVQRRHSSLNSPCKSNSVTAAGRSQDEQNSSVAVLKSEPGLNSDHSHAFGAEINLGLQHMVRTLSMMSSFPVGGKSHFPAFPVPPSSSTSHAAGDDEVQSLRRSADGKFACPYCTKTYGFKHSLKEHIDVHRGRRPHVCRHCGAAFAHLASLCSHIRRRHEDRMPSDFRCTLCGEKLMNLQSLKQHRTWRHKDAPRLSDPLPTCTPGVDQQCETSPSHVERTVDAKKDLNSTAAEACRIPLSLSQWSTMSSGSGVNSVEAKQVSSGISSAAVAGRKDVSDILAFDGFDFRGYLPPTGDFLTPSTQSDWSVNQSSVGAGESTMGLASEASRLVASTAPKCFVGTDMLLTMQPHQQQQQQMTRSVLPYRHNAPFTDTATGYVSSVCAGCTTKFQSDSEYRQHIACNPDHVQLPWRH